MLWAAAVVGLLAWLTVDVRTFMGWQTQLSTLAASGRVAELDALCERMVRSRRPLMALFLRLAMPGGLEALAASQLVILGRPARALELAQRAQHKAGRHPTLVPAMVATRVLAHLRLLQQEEAVAAWEELKALPNVPVGLQSAGITVLLSNGKLEEARSLAASLLGKDPGDESAHLSAAAAASELGDFAQALRWLEYEPRPATHLHKPKDVATLQKDDAGMALLAAQEAERNSVTRPSQHLQAALVHLAALDLPAAEFALSNARALLGGHPAMALHFHMAGQLVAGLAQDTARFEKHLQETQALLQHMPQCPGFHLEARITQVRALVWLRRPQAALEVLDALPANLPPLSRHHALSLRGDALAALGENAPAQAAFSAVLQDGIPGILTQRAQASLQALQG